MSKTQLLVGAAGLLLFIVGIKRSYRLDDQRGTVVDEDTPTAPPAEGPAS